MATYAIGDIQGCMAALQALLTRIRFDSAGDRLWFVGDLVNRGPASAEVLRFVRGLGDAAITVLGNHDLHLLAVAARVAPPRRSDTLTAILTAPDRTELLTWLRQRPLIHREDPFLLVHAGLYPQWTPDEAVALAHEVEQRLRSEDCPALLRSFYGSRIPATWSPRLRGRTRLSAVLNACLRMRTCSPDGALNLRYTGPPEEAPAGCLAWFDVPGRKSAGLTIVCGHWSALGLHLTDQILALDTGCVWGRELTAVRLEDRAVFQVSCSEQARDR